MLDATAVHEEKETILVDVELPGHDERVTTPLFTRTRLQMLARAGHRCEISGETETEGGPIEFHHMFVERCLANAVDFARLYRWLHILRDRAQAAIDWIDGQLKLGKTFEVIDPIEFADDMTVNGVGITKRLHTGKGEGIHAMPFPLWQFWAIGKRGFRFVGNDCVVDEEATLVDAEIARQQAAQ